MTSMTGDHVMLASGRLVTADEYGELHQRWRATAAHLSGFDEWVRDLHSTAGQMGETLRERQGGERATQARREANREEARRRSERIRQLQQIADQTETVTVNPANGLGFPRQDTRLTAAAEAARVELSQLAREQADAEQDRPASSAERIAERFGRGPAGDAA